MFDNSPQLNTHSDRWKLFHWNCSMERSGLNNFLRPTQIKAVVGLHKISEFRRPSKFDDNNNADTPKNSAYEMGLKQIVVHPDYQCQHPDNDIGKQRRFHGHLIILQTIQFSISIFIFKKRCFSYDSTSHWTALLELAQPITFSDTIKPICIAHSSTKQNDSYVDESAIISGWGFTNENQEIGTLSVI